MPSPSTEKFSELALNPWAPRRKPISACRCCQWFAITIGFGITVVVCAMVYRFGTGFVDKAQHPHRALYRNGSIEDQAVVRPLIDEGQQFDIAVSVWLRAPKEEEEEWRSASSTTDDEEYTDDKTFRIPIKMDDQKGNFKGTIYKVVDKHDESYELYLKGDKKLLYIPLYSDIAFRGVNLKDKNVFADVNFQIPTSRFLEKNLTASDLRGTFVLVPSSKSLLKHVTNFSSWMPDAVYDSLPPVRSWPFHLGSSSHTDKTLPDLAVESFGISVDLLSFSEIPSRCDNSTVNSTDQASSMSEDIATMSFDLAQAKLKKMKEDIPAYKNHPHVVTRTKLHVVDETHLFDKEAYDKAHQALRSTSCGQHPGSSAKPSRNFCGELSFSGGGILRTSLELEVPNEDGDDERQWAYGPFMNTIPSSAGPKDIITIPVNRENCSIPVDGHVEDLEEPELMNITWHISFSGRSPGKHLLSKLIPQPFGVNNSRTDFEKAGDQDSAELLNGLRGFRFTNESHPRRRVFIAVMRFIANLSSSLFELLYWFTRVHTVSISTTGAILRAIGLALSSFLELDLMSGKSAMELSMTAMLFLGFGFPLPFQMFKTALRLEFASTRKDFLGMSLSIPVIRRVLKTHKERASERLDKKTSWKMILCCMIAVYCASGPLRCYVINPLHPPAPEQKFSKINEYVRPIIPALSITAYILQITLNHRSRFFAGNYKITAYLNLLGVLLTLTGYVPALVGRPESRSGLSLYECILTIVYMVEAFQAFTLPNVSQREDDEDND